MPDSAANPGLSAAGHDHSGHDHGGHSHGGHNHGGQGAGGGPGGGRPGGGPAGPPQRKKIDGVARILAVSSGKGGVGKSTVAANLAAALARSGLRVGLADMDIYGPSVPVMFGVADMPQPDGDTRMIRPIRSHGIELMSMGFFLDDSAPVIWRGPMAMSATRQFLRGVAWGQLDVLIVDLPPGTGDIALTLAQEVPLDGGLVVTTPQDVALDDVRRGIAMFEKVNTPVVGVVQNMAGLTCPECGFIDQVFGERSREEMESELGFPVLAELPLVPAVCTAADSGTPIVLSDPGHGVSETFRVLADAAMARLKDGPADGTPEPKDVEHDKAAGELRIRWSDGNTTQYTLAGLRGWCPCAQCQGHSGELRFVEGTSGTLTGVEMVGRYALRMIWSDGHETGIYSYPWLLELADKPECQSGAGQTVH